MIGYHYSRNQNDQTWCPQVSFDKKCNLMVMVFLSKHVWIKIDQVPFRFFFGLVGFSFLEWFYSIF